MADTILEVKNLKKHFNTPKGMLHAVDGVNFSIEKGKTLGIVGESGCGKSTTGRVILRLLEATEGEIFFEGKNIRKFNKTQMRKLREDIQIIFQDPFASLNPRMTVSEIIGEPLIIHKLVNNKKELSKKVKELMDLVGLSQRLLNTYPHELDGGRRQRIGIARALSLNPKFIVCDEPVSALDVSIQAQILNLMHFSDDIAVMYLGQLVEKASSVELFKNPRHPYTKALLSAIPVANLKHKMDRIELHGEITSPINPAKGCRFSKRCAYVRLECSNKDPMLNEISEGHFVACHLVNNLVKNK